MDELERTVFVSDDSRLDEDTAWTIGAMDTFRSLLIGAGIDNCNRQHPDLSVGNWMLGLRLVWEIN